MNLRKSINLLSIAIINLRIVPILVILVTWTDHTNSNESSNSWERSTCTNSNNNLHNEQHCKTSETSVFITDSINYFFQELDTDETDYLIIDELIPSTKTSSITPLGDAEALERAIKYLGYLDENLDGVIDIYELRFNLYAINANPDKFGNDPGFIYWMQSFVGEAPQKYFFHLVKIYQLFDEDINGKLTWKEIRMAIKMAELFNNVNEELLMNEQEKEELVAKIKANPHQKWVNLEELWGLLYKLGVDSDAMFYEWTKNYLGGNSERQSELVKNSTKQEFSNVDTDSNGNVTKGELTAVLHKNRPNYYSFERINRKWTRVDRNQDGVVSFNEYAFLENLKHPQVK